MVTDTFCCCQSSAFQSVCPRQQQTRDVLSSFADPYIPGIIYGVLRSTMLSTMYFEVHTFPLKYIKSTIFLLIGVGVDS